MEEKWINVSSEIDVEKIMENIRKRIEDKKAKGIYKEEEIEDIENVELLPLPDILDVPVVFDVDEIEKTFENIEKLNLQISQELHKVRNTSLFSDVKEGIKLKIKRNIVKIREKILPLLKFLSLFIVSDIYLNRAKIDQLTDVTNTFRNNIFSALNVHKEHLKILHNYIAHITTEITKLKIENDELKVKIKELESKLELLSERERILEKETIEKE